MHCTKAKQHQTIIKQATAAAAARDLRDLVGKGAEGLSEGECLGQHGHTQAQHSHCSQGQGGGDDTHNGTRKDGQQVPTE